jgi:hypothetical protein
MDTKLHLHWTSNPSPKAQVVPQNLIKTITKTERNIQNLITISIHSKKIHRKESNLQLIYTSYCEVQGNHSKQARQHNYSSQAPMHAEAFIRSWLNSQRTISSEIMKATYFLRHAKNRGERMRQGSRCFSAKITNGMET